MKTKELFILEALLILMASTKYQISKLERSFMGDGRIKVMNSSSIRSGDQKR
ncbi:MAG: hypothetical protein PHH14_00595 [Candidatus Margulisbacteria bacterium]|nr:hypothetical protein [Candidatus Margulisiibacteriota bacterium]